MTKHRGEHQSSESIKRSRLSSDLLLEHNGAGFTVSSCFFSQWFGACWILLLLNMVSVKLLFFPLQKKTYKDPLAFFSILRSQSEQVRDRDNNKATHIRYGWPAHWLVTDLWAAGVQIHSECQEIKQTAQTSTRKHSPKPGDVPSTKHAWL